MNREKNINKEFSNSTLKTNDKTIKIKISSNLFDKSLFREKGLTNLSSKVLLSHIRL